MKLKMMIRTGCLLLAATVSQAAYLPGYSYRQEISVVNMGNGTSLANFPLLIDPGAGNNVYANSLSPNGYDITFTAADGTTVLPEQMVSFNAVGNTMEAWVNTTVPTVGTTNKIYMYYGKPGVVSNPSSTATWSSGGYSLVAHLGDAGPTYSDSSASGNSFTSVGGTVTTVSGGKVGSAAYFNGSSALASTSANGLATPNGYTVQAWAKNVYVAGANNYVLSMYGTSYNSLPMNLIPSAGAWNYYDNYYSWQGVSTNANLCDNTWHYYVGEFNGSTLSFYVDGSLAASGPITAASWWGTQAQQLFLGSDFNGTQQMQGLLDEFRISQNQWTSDQVLANFNDQNNPNNFVLFSDLTHYTPEPSMIMLLFVGGAIVSRRRRKIG